MLSGLEASVLTQHDIKRVEVALLKKLRGLMQGAAVVMTNYNVRRAFSIFSVSSTLKCRRLLLLRSIFRYSSDLQPLIAVLFGTTAANTDPQLLHGKPRPKSNPWIQLVWQDLQFAIAHCPALYPLAHHSFFDIVQSPLLQPAALKTVRSYQSDADPIVRATAP